MVSPALTLWPGPLYRLCCPLLVVAVFQAGCGPASDALNVRSQPISGEYLAEGPVARFDRHAVDLGEIVLDRPAIERNAKFGITNHGNAALKVTKIRLSCGRASVSMPKSAIAAGDSESIKLGIRIRDPGKRAVSASVWTNGSDVPTVLRVQWEALFPIRCDPEELLFGDLLRGETRTMTVKVDPIDARSACRVSEVRLLQVDAGGLFARLTRDSVVVTVTAGADCRRFRSTLYLQLANCGVQSLAVPVSWRVVPEVAVVPEVIYLGPVPASSTWSRSILLRANGAGRLDSLLEATNAGKPLSYEVTWDELTPTVWKGVCHGITPRKIGVFHETLRLGQVRDSESEVVVSVSGFVEPRKE